MREGNLWTGGKVHALKEGDAEKKTKMGKTNPKEILS